jgi:hypothetical protein
MKVIYHDRARQGEEEYLLLQQATKRLEEVLANSTDPVTAEWDRAEDAQHRLHYTLRLSDWAGSVMAIFDPDELQVPTRLRSRFNWLWGDLLQIRSSKLLKAVLADGQEDH